MIRIILSGCFGKMGHVIRDCVSSRNDCEIVAGVDIGDGKRNSRCLNLLTQSAVLMPM